MWVGLFGDSQRKVLSSRFPLFKWFVVSNTKIPIGCGIENSYFRDGNDQPSLAKREIEVLPHRCDLETGRSSELYSARKYKKVQTKREGPARGS
jgi:hypothetical protein